MPSFEEPKPLNDVAKFHETFNLPIEEEPVIPAKERCALRISLLQEELDELKQAIEDNDLIEVADAFCDLQYVLSGAILEFGLANKFKHLFEEVQRSNMSKVCQSKEEAEDTLEHYKKEKNTEGFILPKGSQYLVYRATDKKVLKSVKYSPASLKGIIEK